MVDQGFAVLLVLLLIGLVQGFTICNISCGPLLFLRLAGRRKGTRQDLGIAALFCLPRIFVLTFLGGLLGALGYTLDSVSNLSTFPWFRALGYLLLAFIMISTGLVFLGALRSGSCSASGGLKAKVIMALMKLGPRRKGEDEGRFMLFAGLLVSMICFVEIAGLSALVAGFMGIDRVDLGGGVLWGASSMFFYSMGLTIPIILFALGASFVGRIMKRGDVRGAGGMVLLLLGSLLLIFSIYSFLDLIL
ncbi:MAG: sulfite exporter TauE/SafE family protein [Thermoplasmatota archaeon]